MRLTALCICGTLLAFLTLSWTTADEGGLLGVSEFGPCTATLKPEGPCRPGQDESTCPYLFSLPPLTLQLPNELRELEKIVEDLQKLKDSVDQLREMCADCTVSQTERECGRKREREHERLNEGTDGHKDERKWLNERNPKRPKDLRHECGTDWVKVENTMEEDGDTDAEKITILDEKGRKKWEAERESNKGVVKENEREETLKEVADMDGKTMTEGAKGKDKLGQAKVPTAGGNERVVDMVRKKVVEKNNRETDKDGKGNSKGDPEDTLENGKKGKITSNGENKERTEESDHHVWQAETQETEKKTQTEEDKGGDEIKMSEGHDEHTNKEREQHGEERKKEMEKGIKVERNNEKPKQTESIGRAEKGKTIKEGEVEEEDRERGTEIKTEEEKTVQSVQRDGDGELASSKTTEGTDFVSISPTPHSIISFAPGHDSMDSDAATTFTSSLPSPSASSSNSHLIADVNQGMTIAADRLPTRSTDLAAAGVSEHPRPYAEEGLTRPTTEATINTPGGPGQQITSTTSRLTSTTTARPGAGSQGRVSSPSATTTTRTPRQNFYTTMFPGVADRSRWTAKKNTSSNAKTGVKPLPGGQRPGGKHKPAIKPEADQKLSNPKNDRKPDRAPLPEKKTKHDQKQKPSYQKPKTDQKFKPGRDPTQVHIPKPDQRPLPDHLAPDQNLKNNQIPKHKVEHTTDQSQLPVQKPKSHQKSMLPVQRPTSHQRPETVDFTGSDKEPATDQESESVDIPIITQNSKPGEKPNHPIKTDRPDQTQKPHKMPKSEDQTKPDQGSTVNQFFTPVQEPKPETSETTSFTPKPNQKPLTELTENYGEIPLPESKSDKDSTPERKSTPDHSQIKPPDQKPKPSQKIPKINQKPKTVDLTGSDKDPATDREPESAEIPIITQNSKPGEKPIHPIKTDRPDQMQKPHKMPKSEDQTKPDQRSTVNQFFTPVQEPKPETSETTSFTPNPNQKPLSELIENYGQIPLPESKSDKDAIPERKFTPDRAPIKPPDQKPKPSQKIPKINQKPKTVDLTGSDKDPATDRETESSEIPIMTQNSKPGEKPIHPVKTDRPDQTQKPHKMPESEDQTKPDQRSTVNQFFTPVQEPKPETRETFTPKPNQKPVTELKENSGEIPLPDSKSDKDSTPERKFTPDRSQIKPPDQKPKPSQKIPKINQKPKTVDLTSSDKDPATDQEPETVEIPIITQNSKPGEKPIHPIKTDRPDQWQKPHNMPKSEDKTKPDQRSTVNQFFTPVQEPKPEPSETTSFTPKPNQKPVTELLENFGEIPLPESKSDKDSTPERKSTPDRSQIKPPDQKPKPSQKIPKINQKPKTVDLTGSDKEPATDREPESAEIPIITQNSKPGKKLIHPIKTDRPDQTQKLHKMPKSEDQTKPDQRSTVNQFFTPVQEPKPETSETANPTPKPNQKPLTELMENYGEIPLPESKSDKDSTPERKFTPDRSQIKPPYQKPKPSQKIPKINQKPKPTQKRPEVITGQRTKPNMKPRLDQTPETNQGLRTPQPVQTLDLNPKSLPDEIPEAESDKTFKPRPPPRRRPPTRPTVRPGATQVQRPKPAVQLKPSPKTKADLDPPQISGTKSDDIQNSQTDKPSAPGPVTQIADVSRSPGDTEFSPSTMKTLTLGPKTSNSLETGPLPPLHTLTEGVTMSPNTRVTSDLRPQTAGPPPSIPTTTRPNKIIHVILPSVFPSTNPGSTKPNQAANPDPSLKATVPHNVEESAPRQSSDPDRAMIHVPTPGAQTASTNSPDLRSTTPATSGPRPLAAESSTPSARELRVKINQVAAFFNNSLSPNGGPPDRRPKEQPEDSRGGSRSESRLPTLIPTKVTVPRDCSDHLLRGETRSGVYLVTPDPRSRSFPVFCDMQLDGGGWTLLQRRKDGSVSFNRTWAEYRSGFGELDGGEFWLGNSMIHLLTRDRDMVLRVELEDFNSVMEHAEYEVFRVASERMRYRLTVGGYSGTAGDALRFSKSYDHNNKAFSTPDRDYDRYPSGNCGAYYSSGWWFDACMAANLNGRYYMGSYKGVRDGIFWGTWHNISTEYYPTNDRQSFKSVRMMTRPKGFAP